MKKTILTIAIAATALLNAGAQVVIDFNSNATGQLFGQNGTLSTGLTGTWAGATSQNVAVGDLTSTYSTAQTGTPQKFVGTTTSTSVNSNTYVSLSTPATGTVYFSFLGDLASTSGRVGLSLNSASVSSEAGFNVLIFGNATAPGLAYRNGTATVPNDVPPNVVPIAVGDQLNVQFVVGRITFTGGNDTMELWLNPNLSGGSLGGADFTNSTTNIGTDLHTIGAYAYGSTSSGNQAIDNIRIGSSLAAVAIPEPGSMSLVGVAVGALLLLRRRRAQA